MKTARNSIALIMMMLVAVALAFAANDRPATRVTMGQFARDLAATARASGGGAASGRIAGIDFAAGGNTPLTEAGAMALLRQTGFQVSSSSPERTLTRQQADVLLGQFRSWMVAQNVNGGAPKPVPSNLGDCLAEINHGQCVVCCKELGGSASTCSKACMVINKPSESEPLP
jgi:hypothetical protein